MKDTKRILIVVAIIIALSGIIITVDYMRTQGTLSIKSDTKNRHFYNGVLSIYLKDKSVGQFSQKDAESLTMNSFIDEAESKEQRGWLVKDVIQKYIHDTAITDSSTVRVSSTKRQKYSFLSWKDIKNEKNRILLVPSRKGTLKLASSMKGLDTRETWVQDVDRIDILN